MTDDEDRSTKRPRRLGPLPLETLGIEELHSYIGELRDEITRVESDIARKQSHRSSADAFFKPRP